jgi:hypothetical protein
LAGRQAEHVEQLVGPGPDGPLGQVGEPADQPEVLAAGQVLVDRGVLSGQADRLAHGLGIAGHVDAEHLGTAAVGPQDGGEDAHGGRLARAVGPEQAEHGTGGHREVDTRQGLHVAESLGQALDPDGRAGAGQRTRRDGGGCHWRTFAQVIDLSQRYLWSKVEATQRSR